MNGVIKNNTDYLIRNMTADDLERVHQIEKEVFPDPWTLNMFKEQLGDNGWGAIVAENKSGIIGYACYYVSHVEGHLTNIAVSPAFRRKSIAKELLKIIIDIILQHGCEFILLEVRPSNTAAGNFYKSYGFEVLYKRPNYYSSPREDAAVMVKYFDEKESKD